MDTIITISDCLKRLEAGEIATIEVYKYDRKRKKGGQIDTLTCLLAKDEKDEKDEKSEGPNNGVDLQALDAEASVVAHRRPNHRKFYTRNVRIVINGHPTAVIQKIHPPLIRTFNGIKTVP